MARETSQGSGSLDETRKVASFENDYEFNKLKLKRDSLGASPFTRGRKGLAPRLKEREVGRERESIPLVRRYMNCLHSGLIVSDISSKSAPFISNSFLAFLQYGQVSCEKTVIFPMP